MQFNPNGAGDNYFYEKFTAQALLFLIFVIEIMILFSRKLEKMRKVSLSFLTFFYCCAGVILFFSASTLVGFAAMKPRNWIELVGMVLSIGNIFLGLFLSTLYKAIAHTYSTAAPNFLLSVFDKRAIFGSVLSKVISSFVVTLSGIKILWP